MQLFGFLGEIWLFFFPQMSADFPADCTQIFPQMSADFFASNLILS